MPLPASRVYVTSSAWGAFVYGTPLAGAAHQLVVLGNTAVLSLRLVDPHR